MNRPHLVDTLHKALGEPITINGDDAKEALENAVNMLIPELSLELTRINGNFIRENTIPNSNRCPPTPLSFLIEGLESDK